MSGHLHPHPPLLSLDVHFPCAGQEPRENQRELFTYHIPGGTLNFIAWEYHYSNIETRSDLGDFPLFCPTSRDLLHTFVHEYLVLYLPVTAIGLVQRSRSSKGIEKHNSLKR